MSLAEVMSVCDVRTSNNKGCKGCINYGKKCNYYKNKYGVARTYEIYDILEIEDLRKRRF